MLRHRRIGLITAAAALCALAGAGGRVQGFPEPNIVPSSWQLDIRYGEPRTIAIQLPGESRPRYWWFWTYTATNRTGDDRNFVPEIEMLTDAGDLVRANQNIPPIVFQAIKDALRNPLLRTPSQTVGRLLQGEDNAVDGIAIWQMPNHDVNHVTFFFQGLSGETHEVTDPVTGDTQLLRKTLMVEYDTPGSAERQELKPWVFQREKWIVR